LVGGTVAGDQFSLTVTFRGVPSKGPCVVEWSLTLRGTNAD
jgi:hypothetical protein